MALLNATLEDTSEILGQRLVRVSDRLKRVLATPAKLGIVDYSRRFLKNLQGDLFVEKDEADTRPSTARTRQCAPPRVALCADGQSAAIQIHRARARSAATTTRRTPRQSGRPTPTPQHEAKWWDELCTEDSQLEAETLDAAENHGVDCASPVSRRQSTSVSICAAAKRVLRGSSKAPPDRTSDDRKDGAGDNNGGMRDEQRLWDIEKYKPPTRPVTPMMKTRFKSDLLWIYEVRLTPAIKQIREREEVAALLAATMDPVKEPQPLQARTQRVLLPLTLTPSRPSTPGNTGHIHRVAAQHAENGVFFPPRPHTAPRVEFCIPDSGCVHPHALSRLRPRRPGGTILRAASPALHEVRTSAPSPQQDIARTASPSPQQDIARTSSSSPQQDIARTSSSSPQQDFARTSSPSRQQDIARTSSPSPQQDIARTSSPSLADLTVRTDSPSLLQTTTVRETAPRASRSLHTSDADNYTCARDDTARRTSARSVTPSECARLTRSRREGVGRRRPTLRLRSTCSDPVSPWTPEEMQKWLHETRTAARRATRKSRQRRGMDVSSPLASPLDDAIRILVNKKTTRATLPYNSRKMQEIMQSVRWHDGRPEPIPIDIDAIDVPESTKPAFRLVTPRVKARTLPLQ